MARTGHAESRAICSLGPYRTGQSIDALADGGATPSPGTVGEIYAFYLHPDFWGSGLADDLMAETLRALADDGWPLTRLWVLEKNERGSAVSTPGAAGVTGLTAPHAAHVRGPSRGPDAACPSGYSGRLGRQPGGLSGRSFSAFVRLSFPGRLRMTFVAPFKDCLARAGPA